MKRFENVATAVVMQFYNIYVNDLRTVSDEKIEAVFIVTYLPFIIGNFDITKHLI